MRKMILAAAIGALGLAAMPAQAQSYGHSGGYDRNYRDDGRDYRGDGRGYRNDGRGYRRDIRNPREDCRRAMRHADNRWEMRRAREICQRARYSGRGRGYDDHRRY